MRVCSIEDCSERHYGRGFCRRHYDQLWKASGGHLERLSLEERFWAKVNKRGPKILSSRCWDWTGSTYASGHGQIWVNSRLERAHRVSWKLAGGKIPKGKLLCHRCDRPSCVRPSHLWVGSQKDNMADAAAKGRTRNQNSGKSECSHGHRLTNQNVYVTKEGWRQCRKCKRARLRKYRAAGKD